MGQHWLTAKVPADIVRQRIGRVVAPVSVSGHCLQHNIVEFPGHGRRAGLSRFQAWPWRILMKDAIRQRCSIRALKRPCSRHQLIEDYTQRVHV